MKLQLRAPLPATLEANTSQQREEFSGAAVARSETGGPPVEMSSTPQGATPGDLCAADAQATIRREREVSASPTPERPQRAARAAATRSESRPRDVRASATGRAAAARSRSPRRGEETPPLVLRVGNVAVVTQYGRDFVPLPSRIEIPEDRLLPDAALAWDGLRYTRREFVTHYGNDNLFFEARRTSELARAFMAVWYDFCKQTDDHSSINHLLVLMRRTEWRGDLNLALRLPRADSARCCTGPAQDQRRPYRLSLRDATPRRAGAPLGSSFLSRSRG